MKIEVTKAEANRMLDWITSRGGVAVWECLDLRNAGAKVFTPARTTTGEPTTRPGWQYAGTPVEIVTDPADIAPYEETLYASIPVSLKHKGMLLILSDPSQRRLDKAMRDCAEKHGNSHYRKGDLDRPTMEVYYAVPL